jgi:hypothetical protein
LHGLVRLDRRRRAFRQDLPWFMTVIVWASCITTAMLCSMSSTVAFRATVRISSQKPAISASERPWVGSSRIRSFGDSASPIANSKSR